MCGFTRKTKRMLNSTINTMLSTKRTKLHMNKDYFGEKDEVVARYNEEEERKAQEREDNQ